MKVKVGCMRVCARTHSPGFCVRPNTCRDGEHFWDQAIKEGHKTRFQSVPNVAAAGPRRDERRSLSALRTNKSDKWLTPTAKLPDKLIIADSASHSGSPVTKLNLKKKKKHKLWQIIKFITAGTLALQAKSLKFCSANVTHPHGGRHPPDVHANTLRCLEAFHQTIGLLKTHQTFGLNAGLTKSNQLRNGFSEAA